MAYELKSAVVEIIGNMNFEGNIVPHAWFQHDLLKLPSGRPNTVAILLLADIVYWYRPVIERDETTSQLKSMRQKFSQDRMYKTYAQWADYFGFTKRQVQDAVAFLKRQGLITVEVKPLVLDTGHITNNVVFIEPIPEHLAEISANVTRLSLKRDTPPVKTRGASRFNVTRPSPERDTYTETTAKTPSKSSQRTHHQHQSSRSAANDESQNDDDALVAALQKVGVTLRIAKRLVAESATEQVRQQLAWLPARQNVKNTAGTLVRAIKDSWPAPADMMAFEQEQAAAAATQKHRTGAKAAAEARVAARIQAEAALNDYYMQLSPGDQDAIEVQADAELHARSPVIARGTANNPMRKGLLRQYRHEILSRRSGLPIPEEATKSPGVAKTTRNSTATADGSVTTNSWAQ